MQSERGLLTGGQMHLQRVEIEVVSETFLRQCYLVGIK